MNFNHYWFGFGFGFDRIGLVVEMLRDMVVLRRSSEASVWVVGRWLRFLGGNRFK